MQTIEKIKSAPPVTGIVESREAGLVVLSPAQGRPVRRVLFVNNYGGAAVWEKVKQGEMPPHHMWGCLELVRAGYEVALAEAVPDFNRRRPYPHDLKLFKMMHSWLRADDIVYCGHNVLFWLPFLKATGLYRRHVVSLLFAKEPLDFAKTHSAIIALTPTAQKQASLLAPKTKIAHLGWGADLNAYPQHPYRPDYLLHCGIAGRDLDVTLQASKLSKQPIRMISPGRGMDMDWPAHVTLIDGGFGYNHENKKVTFAELVNEHYAGSAGSLIVTFANPDKDHALGFTQLIEALAMGQPVIHTRTGALADEIDVEKAGCGIGVPPGDPAALAAAMDSLMNDHARAEVMGKAARRLAESHYNIERFGRQLKELFESL